MSAIRSDVPAVLPHTGANHPATAARAAQTAFFRAALGEVDAPKAAAVETVRAPLKRDDASDGRSMRPGSLLDIRV